MKKLFTLSLAATFVLLSYAPAMAAPTQGEIEKSLSNITKASCKTFIIDQKVFALLTERKLALLDYLASQSSNDKETNAKKIRKQYNLRRRNLGSNADQAFFAFTDKPSILNEDFQSLEDLRYALLADPSIYWDYEAGNTDSNKRGIRASKMLELELKYPMLTTYRKNVEAFMVKASKERMDCSGVIKTFKALPAKERTNYKLFQMLADFAKQQKVKAELNYYHEYIRTLRA